MSKSEKTQQNLLEAARSLFWNRGYSNVSVRDITKCASVDAALVSRYFGGKQGLFEATLVGAFDWPELQEDRGNFLELIVNKQAKGLHESGEASAIKMLIMNASDPDVGEIVRSEVTRCFTKPITEVIGPPKAQERLAMMMAVIVGASIMRHDIRAAGMSDCSEEQYGAQLRHLVTAAMAYGQDLIPPRKH
ncbi:MAG: TetR/AcrR family transcriptional regulator [Rhodobacteraceae bacterium]|nr:TetR/AcrR family transcriptional regulator [Paracoccaceae bacterium]